MKIPNANDQTPKKSQSGKSAKARRGDGLVIENSLEFGGWRLGFFLARGFHSRVEEADEGIEAVFLGADDEAAERIGEERLP